jgi:hypothetical protein
MSIYYLESALERGTPIVWQPVPLPTRLSVLTLLSKNNHKNS